MNLLSFGQAVKVGIGVSIVSDFLVTICRRGYRIYNLIFMNFIEPDFMNQLLQVEKAKWIEAEMSSEQMEGNRENVQSVFKELLSHLPQLLLLLRFWVLSSLPLQEPL